MKKHLTVVTATALAAALTGALSVSTASAAPGDLGPGPSSSTAITQVTGWGFKITGLALEYGGVIDIASIDPAAFAVEATNGNRTGARNILRAYTSPDIRFREVPTPGRYIILELNENDSLASWSSSNLPGAVGAVKVTQRDDIVGHDGTILAAPMAQLANASVKNLVVDDYVPGSLTATNGIELPYQFFSPALEPGEKYPLVLTLHGHGESGDNNTAQIAGNQVSTAFADPSRQARHPSFVLAPQAAPSDPGLRDHGWWNTDVQDAVIELLDTVIAANPAIDTERIYISGLSMGSYGSWALLQDHPERFAAGILVCGAGNEAAALAALVDVPIWALHSADDFMVRYDAANSDYRIFQGFEAAGWPVVWSQWGGTLPQAEQQAFAEVARHEANVSGAKHIFTTFPAGTTPMFSHAAWIPAYENDVVIDWLYAQGVDEDIEGGTGDIEVRVKTGAPGGLSLYLASNRADMGVTTLNATLNALTASGRLPNITVADTRTANPGWSLTARSGDFTSIDSPATIEGRNLGLVPRVVTEGSSQSITLGGAVPAGVGFTGGALLGSAPAGRGLGTAVIGGDLSLTAPTNLPGGLTLKSTIKITLL